MENTKRCFKWFDITQYEEEAGYLREMHNKGWKFNRIVFPGIYYFEKCEPEDVIYQLDYNQEGIENKSEYVRLFEDCGWEYLFDFVGYSYFRKPSALTDGETSIFCDDESRLDMMKRSYKGRLLPLVCIFLSAVLPQFMMNAIGYEEKYKMVLAVVFGMLGIVYIAIFIRAVIHYRKFKNKVNSK